MMMGPQLITGFVQEKLIPSQVRISVFPNYSGSWNLENKKLALPSTFSHKWSSSTVKLPSLVRESIGGVMETKVLKPEVQPDYGSTPPSRQTAIQTAIRKEC